MRLSQISRDLLHANPNNARRRHEYAKKEDSDLESSIREHGLLQPLVVTAVRAKDGDGYVILAGHRRHAALQALGIEEAPCIVLEAADDQEALAVLLTENASHKPVDPLKEAEAVAKLVEGFAEKNHPCDRAAAVLGKSVAWVRGRLRLTTLSAAWRKAHGDLENPVHEWPIAHLELVAALPEAVQDQVLAHYQGAFHDTVPLLMELRRTVADHTRTLDHVPWDPNAPDVAVGTPPCVSCPRRESAQGGLFGRIDEAKGDRCLDMGCFAAKKQAAVLARINEALAKYGDALAIERCWTCRDVTLPEGIPAFNDFELVPVTKTKGGFPVLRLKTLKVAFMAQASRDADPAMDGKPPTKPKAPERDRRKDLDRRRQVRALSVLRGNLLGQPVEVGTDKHPEQLTPPELNLPSLEDLIALVLAFGTGRAADGYATGDTAADLLKSALADTRNRGKEAALRTRQALWDAVKVPLARAVLPFPGVTHEAADGCAVLAEVVCGICGANWQGAYLSPAVEAIPEPRSWAGVSA